MDTFFESPQQLAQMFTEQNQTGKYMTCDNLFPDDEFSGCMKPIEYFMADIINNLKSWSADQSAIFYKTKRCWYMFERNEQHPNVVNMSCFGISSWQRFDTWANLHSVESLGKGFLAKHRDKRVPLFFSGNMN